MRSRLLAASAVTLAAALAGCSGSGSDDGTSADAPGSAAAPSSQEGASSSKAASSSTTSSPKESSSPSSGASSSEAPESGAPGKTVDENQIVAMAKKVGCTNPKFQKSKATSPAAKVGTKGGVDCVASGKGYIIALTKPATGPKAMAMSLKKVAENAPVPYLYGDNWALFAVADAKANSATFDKKIIQDAQRKIGAGEIATA